MSNNELTKLIFQSQIQIALDREKLRNLAQDLLHTEEVIERGALAYISSRWTLESLELTRSRSQTTTPNPRPLPSLVPALSNGLTPVDVDGERDDE